MTRVTQSNRKRAFLLVVVLISVSILLEEGDTRRTAPHSVEVTGTVKGFHGVTVHHAKTGVPVRLRVPRITLRTEEHRPLEVFAQAAPWKELRAGDEVRVRYHPDSPHRFRISRISGPEAQWTDTAFLLLAALAALAWMAARRPPERSFTQKLLDEAREHEGEDFMNAA